MDIVLCTNSEWLISEAAYAIYAPCMYQPSYMDYKTKMEEWISNPSVRIYTCDEKDVIVGILALKKADETAEILGIAVAEELHGQGIGRKLILQAMKSENLKSISAQTDDDAIGFYRKCGFSEEREVVSYPDGEAVRYNCVLQNPNDGYICKIASLEEMEQKWDYEISIHSEKENWIVWKKWE